MAVATGAIAATQKDLPKPAEVMFDRPHLKQVKSGDTLTYTLKREVSDTKLVAPGFTDTITVKINSVDAEERKDLTVNVFTGERARDPRDISGMTGNPVLVFYLDRAVFGYASVAGGKRAYLKNRFRIELRDTARIDPVKIKYKSGTVDGYRIKVIPYALDGNKAKMRGYTDSSFEIFLSDAIPGHFAEFRTDIKSTVEGSPSFVETLTLDGVEGIE